ncbi:MAG: ATP-binding cassette domain-containing protein [Deltaproteobacteria bacterium]|nr:ATP-binding cassette domain-containing protein [Deltaproteobacteria bacterium]
MPAIIELEEVTVYNEDGRAVFEDVNLNFSGGQCVLIAAPPASGKGALLKLLSGHALPDKGVVHLFGKDTRRLTKTGLNDARKRMGFILQDPILISNLKVIENVALPLLYHSELTADECYNEALKMLDLAGFAGDLWVLPGLLPVYARKSVAAAKALVMGPEVIVCENPAHGLNEDELAHLSGIIAGYHLSHPASLLIVTARDETEIGAIKPGRTIHIQDGRFRE